MKKSVRMAAMALAGIMSISLLAGCGTKNNNVKQPEQAVKTKQVSKEKELTWQEKIDELTLITPVMLICEFKGNMCVEELREGDRISAVYSELVTFRLNFTAPDVQVQMDDARVYWFQGNWTNDVNFTHIGGGIYEFTFDTTDGAYGTYGLVFRGIPNDPV